MKDGGEADTGTGPHGTKQSVRDLQRRPRNGLGSGLHLSASWIFAVNNLFNSTCQACLGDEASPDSREEYSWVTYSGLPAHRSFLVISLADSLTLGLRVISPP